MPSRRAILSASGAALAAGLAGCIDDGTTGTDSETPTPTDSGTPTGTPTPETRELAFGEAGPDGVTATDTRIQSSVRHLRNVDHNGITADEVWYLFVTVEPGSEGPDPTAFRLRTSSESYEPLAVTDDYLREQVAFINGDAYGSETTGWLLFTVPYEDDPEEARLALDRTTWTLPEDAVAGLRATPPAFELLGVSTPTEPPHDEPFTVTLDVRNEGAAGTFRAAFNYTAPLYAPEGLSVAVPADETVTLEPTVGIHLDGPGMDPGDSVEAGVVSAGGTADWSVTLGD